MNLSLKTIYLAAILNVCNVASQECCSFPEWSFVFSLTPYTCSNYPSNWCGEFGDIDLDDNGVKANEACCGKWSLLIP